VCPEKKFVKSLCKGSSMVLVSGVTLIAPRRLDAKGWRATAPVTVPHTCKTPLVKEVYGV